MIDKNYASENVGNRSGNTSTNQSYNNQTIDTESAIDIRQIIGILRRQYKLILATIFLVTAIALLYTFTLVPRYTATALVYVDTSGKNLLNEANQFATPLTDNARVESEVEILRSDNVLLGVINALNLTADPEFGVKLSTRAKILQFLRVREATLPDGQELVASVLDTLRGSTVVRRKGLTFLISVAVQARSPERAAELANAVVKSYIAMQLQSKVDSALFGRDRIVSESEDARKAVILAENGLTEYLTNNIDELARATGRSDIGQIRDTIAGLAAQKQKANANIENIRKSINTKDWSSLVTDLQDNAATELQRQRLELLTALDGASVGSVASVNLQSEIAKVDAELENAAKAKVSALEGSLQAADAELTKARQSFTDIATSAELPADALAQIYQLQQTARNATSTYQLLLSRAQDLETQAAVQIADSRLMSAALVPNSPSFPNTRLILAVAFIFAVGLGIGLAFLYEMFIGGFTSSEQLEALSGFTVAAVLPLQTGDASSTSVADVVVDRPMSGYSEEVRRLRANLELHLRSKRIGHSNRASKLSSIVMVSSALPSEGKSTIALSLARSYALDRYKTLLIDCDLRRPSIHKQLALNPSSELMDYLRREPGQPLSKEFAITDPKAPLTVVIGSRPSDIPTDHLLNDHAFIELLNSARQKFDYIIIDTPPVDPVVDGLYVAEYSDAVVFVVNWAKTSQRIVVRSLNTLRKYVPDTKQIFLALNQDQHKGGATYKYGGYYSE